MMVGQFDNFLVIGDRTVLFYRGSVPIARMEVECPVQESSIIRLLNAYMCDGDAVLIDGSKCRISSMHATD
jgi:hypothetical protein